VSDQIDRVAAGLRDELGDHLTGVYLHGSLVLGCFNPARSDIDLIAVTRGPLGPDARARVFDVFRRESGSYDRPGWPRPLEVSSLSADDLRPWRYPTPYDLHFSSGATEDRGRGMDYDLAAHISILRRRGRAVLGPPVAAIFPTVPYADYLDSLGRDFASCRDEGHDWPRYAILSMTRVWATIASGELHSKASGARWALERLPVELRPLVESALESYVGDGRDFPVDTERFRRLATFIGRRVSA
jgi:streptomycin 3"-adenylyltransferase